jgi:excisionase family DNA binding protein
MTDMRGKQNDSSTATANATADEGFVSVNHAMQYLALCRASIYKLMDSGDIPYAKFGRSRRIPRAALIEFGKKNTVGAGA